VILVCGRYQFTADQCLEILQIAQEVERRYGVNAWQPGEIRPATLAPVLLAGSEGIHPELQNWGYRIAGSLVINARAETAGEKPMFRDSVAARRCVVPSTGFYEWDRDKRKFFFTMPGQGVLYMAGLYDLRGGKPCYCILTTAANLSMKEIHHRMPLILHKEQIGDWLNEPQSVPDILHLQPPQLEKVSAEAQISLW